MERLEAQRRIFAAAQILLSGSWTQRDVANLIDGLQREDAVERIEDAAMRYLGTEADDQEPFRNGPDTNF